jgi:hypothetical protein
MVTARPIVFRAIRHTLRPSHDGLQYHDEVHRTAGEIALLSPESDKVKAQNHFERALAVARQQQAKSCTRCDEHGAALALPGKRDEARDEND